MESEGLISIYYSTRSKAVSIVFEMNTPYDRSKITSYVDAMTEGQSRRISIYEDGMLIHVMRKVEGLWKQNENERQTGSSPT